MQYGQQNEGSAVSILNRAIAEWESASVTLCAVWPTERRFSCKHSQHGHSWVRECVCHFINSMANRGKVQLQAFWTGPWLDETVRLTLYVQYGQQNEGSAASILNRAIAEWESASVTLCAVWPTERRFSCKHSQHGHSWVRECVCHFMCSMANRMKVQLQAFWTWPLLSERVRLPLYVQYGQQNEGSAASILYRAIDEWERTSATLCAVWPTERRLSCKYSEHGHSWVREFVYHFMCSMAKRTKVQLQAFWTWP